MVTDSSEHEAWPGDEPGTVVAGPDDAGPDDAGPDDVTPDDVAPGVEVWGGTLRGWAQRALGGQVTGVEQMTVPLHGPVPGTQAATPPHPMGVGRPDGTVVVVVGDTTGGGTHPAVGGHPGTGPPAGAVYTRIVTPAAVVREKR
jgi:hypothetical protein